MFEHILEKAQARAEQLRSARIERLAETAAPPGITVNRTEDGIVLSGKRLRRRLITDVALRSFGR